MEVLKTFGAILEPDPRHEAFGYPDPTVSDGFRRLQLEDQYKAMVDLDLSANVPEDIRSAFNVTRNLWLYGWFCYPFYTLAAFHALSLLEMALRRRVDQESSAGSVKKSPGLRSLMQTAVGRRWIIDEDITHARRLRDCRQEELDFPPEIKHMFAPEEPWDSSPQKYCQILADTIPSHRNALAHPERFGFGLPTWSKLDLEIARDIIETLYSGRDRNGRD